MGTEIGMLGGYRFQGKVTAGDSSDQKDKMGPGYNNLRRKKEKQQCKVGREEEGSSSNQPQLAAFLLALRDTLIEEPLLYLYDNQSLLKAVDGWIGKGGKATLVGPPDADILAAAIEILRKRFAAGTATFLIKVKVHGGEPANLNEEADILADKAIPDLKVGKEWCQRTNRAGTWTADFMLRQNESRAFLGKYLNNLRVPWRHERRKMMAIVEIIPVAKWLAKIKQ